MENNSNKIYERQYYIDWLRILLISSVFMYHAGMIFVPWGWHVKNDVLYGGALTCIMSFLHSWRMPLLFMISGAGTYYALRSNSPLKYLSERTRRLLIPLIAGIFILVPIQVYLEKINNYNSLADFYMHMFDGVYPAGNFSWHHLWFIAYLFTISLLFSPFIGFLRGGKFMNLSARLALRLSRPFGLNLMIVPLIASQVILRNWFEQETHALYNDWASFTFYVIFFLAGFTLLPIKKILEAAVRYRNLYLAETLLFTAMMFLGPAFAPQEQTGEIIHDVAEIIISWTCSVAVIGYAARYLDYNSRFRKEANEAIYPFYLLHQPVLVIVGFMITRFAIPDFLKAVLIIASSLLLILLVYRVLIKPYNLARLIFGMKIPGAKSNNGSYIVLAQAKGNEADRA